MKTIKCAKCPRNFKYLTEEGICYYCHIEKYGQAPTHKQFGNNIDKK